MGGNNRMRVPVGALSLGLLAVLSAPSSGYESADRTLEIRGFIENATHNRSSRGISKSRNTGQLEFSKRLGEVGAFSAFSLHGTLRGSYDAVYDLNDDEFGDSSGGPVSFPAPGNPAFLATLPMAPPFAPPTQPVFAGTFGPAAAGADGAIPLPGTLGTIASPANPNDGLLLLGDDVHNFERGSVVLAYPSRPCDKDPRGCIDGYLDFDEDELEHPEFNDRLDFLRELYLDGTIDFDNGHELNLRIGRQQVVWGRTDLFRVLDVVNPVDFSRHNIFDELEDIRTPMGIFNAEYRLGATERFDDLNFQLLWKFEKFRPHNLGQGGQPYAILGAGNFFRAMNNCWDNGCTVWNFPAAGVAVDFPANSIGIRQANVPGWQLGETDFGLRLEGVYRGVGFSLNALSFISQFPSLRGGIPSDNPFTPGVESQFNPYNLAFDIDFPRINLLGGSADFYVDRIKSAFRVEVAYTSGEEFPNTLRERLFSESDVIRWVVGIDRPTFIPFLNRTRAFLISAQLFGQHLLDHERGRVNPQGIPTLGDVGMVDFEHNFIATLLVQGNYMNDRLTPQVITAWDFGAGSGAVVPSLEWKIKNSWRLTIAYNMKFGEGARRVDDNRSANPFPPASCAPPVAAANPAACTAPFGSLGVSGFEPIGRFRAGPFGQAINEDELQISVRYQF